MNIETGSGRVAAVAAVIILFATFIYYDDGRAFLLPGAYLALAGYGVVYFACVFILKGFTKEHKPGD